MSYDLFHREGPGRFYRGNLHTHSTNSDGGMTPEAVCNAYRQQGYDFLSITDHYFGAFGYPITDTRPFRTESFTTIIGSELHAPSLENGQAWHILGIGLPLDFGGLLDRENGPALAQRAYDAGAFVALAHPEWYGATISDMQSIPSAHAIEIYNEVCSRLNDKPESWFHADQVLASGRRISALGTDDAHFRATMPKLKGNSEVKIDLKNLNGPNDIFKQLQATAVDPIATELGEETPGGFGCWVWVRAASLDPDLLVEGLKAGDYYTSQGPLIHDIVVSDDRKSLKVVNSPASSVYVTGRPDIISMGFKHAPQITHSTFDVEQHAGSYVRVTVVDAAGKRAWSNPIWLD